MSFALALVAQLPLLTLSAQEHHLPPEATAYELPHDGKPARIPFQLVINEVRVDATINGQGPFRIIVDTGMPIPGFLLFHGARVDALHLEDSGQRVMVAGAGGAGTTSEAVMASGLSAAIGDLSMSKASALVIEKPSGFPPGIDGVIGGALFFHFVVRIDMDQNRIELFDSDKWSPPAGASVVPLVREDGRVFVDVLAAISDEPPTQARVVVDLGAGHALSLNTREDGRFAPPASAIESPLGRGVSGIVLGKLGRVRRVELGSFAFENVVTSFPIGKHQNPGGLDFHDGNLGTEILKRFDLTFDYAGKRLVLEKAKRFSEPFEHEMDGMTLDWEKDGTLKVGSVLPRSPAATAGIEAGDSLVSIDGRPAESLGEDGLRRALTVDGAELKLTLKRGGETIEKRIRLRRLV
jgi:hypothetical protein